jgi:hypothetical protein
MNQETLEEAAEKWCEKHGCGYGGIISIAFETGAKWQAERMYSDEEAQLMLSKFLFDIKHKKAENSVKWFEQFKKK